MTDLRDQIAEAVLNFFGRDGAPTDLMQEFAIGAADRVMAVVEPELERLRDQINFHQRVRLDVEAVLDHALGTEEEDGAGQGLAADVELLAKRAKRAEEAEERPPSTWTPPEVTP